jgi:Icc-related predicted phosphoesterase
MKIVLLSDTHGGHDGLQIPPCDLLVHAGDWSRHGTTEEAIAFFSWFGAQPARLRVATAGNHDLVAEREPDLLRSLARDNDTLWLIEEGAEVLGLKLWASPYSPRHGVWAFQEERGAPIRKHWEAIPRDLDLLVTHSPPFGVCDRIVKGDHVGCEALLDIVRDRAPRVHLFGHVHEAHGEASLEGLPTRFINASNFISTRVRSAPNLDVRQP